MSGERSGEGHALRIETSDGPRLQTPLHAQSVADFHAAIMAIVPPKQRPSSN
jgi:hypothetical protein